MNQNVNDNMGNVIRVRKFFNHFDLLKYYFRYESIQAIINKLLKLSKYKGTQCKEE